MISLKKTNISVYLSFSSDTLQSIKRQNIDQSTKIGNIYTQLWIEIGQSETQVHDCKGYIPSRCRLPIELFLQCYFFSRVSMKECDKFRFTQTKGKNESVFEMFVFGLLYFARIFGHR